MESANDYYENMYEELTDGANVTLSRKDIGSAFCKSVKFIYDSRDYWDIPGLARSINPGFLIPVFFNKTVLQKYLINRNYLTQFGSSTYGTIRKKDGFIISFGINKRDEVIMWLGDIDQLPIKEQHYLRSENIVSSEDIGSEFYMGQIEVLFTDPPPEREVLDARSNLSESIFKKYGFHIHKTRLEEASELKSIVRPLVWDLSGITGSIDSMNKILIESIDTQSLRSHLSEIAPELDTKGLKGLKLLENWLSTLGHSNPKTLTMPFFVLYDLRICVSHRLSKDEVDNRVTKCFERLDMEFGRETFEDLYDALVVKLRDSYLEIDKLLQG